MPGTGTGQTALSARKRPSDRQPGFRPIRPYHLHKHPAQPVAHRGKARMTIEHDSLPHAVVRADRPSTEPEEQPSPDDTPKRNLMNPLIPGASEYPAGGKGNRLVVQDIRPVYCPEKRATPQPARKFVEYRDGGAANPLRMGNLPVHHPRTGNPSGQPGGRRRAVQGVAVYGGRIKIDRDAEGRHAVTLALNLEPPRQEAGTQT